MGKTQTRVIFFKEQNFDDNVSLEIPRKVEAAVLNGDNTYQQNHEARKGRYYHLEKGPLTIATHTKEFPGISVSETKNKRVYLPSADQHEITNTLEN